MRNRGQVNGIAAPEYYIVPRAEVAKYVTEKHRAWLAAPGRNGRVRHDSSMRVFRDPDRKYRNAWETLGLE